MLDRTAIFLIILFTMVSAAAYDHYLTGQGKISPFARMIDYAGLGKYKTEATSQKRIKREIFNQRFSGLQEALGRIENKKSELIRHRREILAELDKVNELMKGEAENYQKIIDKERDRFLAENPEFESKVKGLVGANLQAALKDEQLDKNKVQNFKDSVLVKQQAADQWQSILKTLGREEQIFAENTVTVERQSQEATEETVNHVKSLVEKLDTVTETDWRELMKLYEDLWMQQEMLVEGEELTAQRLQDAYTVAIQQMKSVRNKIAPSESDEMINLAARIESLDAQVRTLMDRVGDDNQESRKIFQETWEINNKFFNNSLVLHREEVKAPVIFVSSESGSTVLTRSRPVMDNPISKPPKQQSIDAQLRPIREKAKENGYYGHTLPSNR